MKILIDTNIFIPLEPTSEVDIETLSDEAARLHCLIQQERHEVFLHPKSLIDIRRDRNESRQRLRLLAYNKYPKLRSVELFPTFSQLLPLATPNSNDEVDNHLLFAVYNNAVNVLVSEDKGIHKKARLLGIDNRVARIADTIRMFESLAHPPFRLPSVVKKKAYEIDVKDSIFNSLRTDYPDFDSWFARCKQSHRDTFVIEEEGKLNALCLFKHENPPEHGLKGKVLKACTFKVDECARGLRYGELLLKALCHHAYSGNYDYIYATAFCSNEAVCEFFENNGFTLVPDHQTAIGEMIYVKTMKPIGSDDLQRTSFDYHLTYGPRYIHPDARSFIVPIQPKYHQMLFPELGEQLCLFSDAQPYGNGITKAYLCHANISTLGKGDLLFFYKSVSQQSIQAMGVVESCIRSDDPSQVAAYVGKRTVYSHKTIDSMCSKPLLAVLFRQANSFIDPIPRKQLERNGVFSHPPQSICSLKKDLSEWLLSHSRM